MATALLPGAQLTDHWLDVPLDHDDPGGEQLTIYAREVHTPQRTTEDLPWLLFLQGGPGGKAPRPVRAGDWLGRALQDFRVLLLDQRGTGRSTPVTARSLSARGGPAEQAGYLTRFRADSIVRTRSCGMRSCCARSLAAANRGAHSGRVTAASARSRICRSPRRACGNAS